MSSILDALKKSERQRRHGEALIFRQASPGSLPGFFPRALLAAVAILLLAAMIAVYIWQRPAPVVTPAMPVANNAEPAQAPSAPIENLAEQATVEPAPKASSVPAAPLSAATVAPAPPAAPRVAGFGQVPWLSALPEAFRNSLPPLAVNIHVYTPDESQRILYINNRQVRRGEQIEGGVVMEEIVQDGVILRFRGQLFKLPRPK